MQLIRTAAHYFVYFVEFVRYNDGASLPLNEDSVGNLPRALHERVAQAFLMPLGDIPA